MQLSANVLLIVAGLFLIANAAASVVAAGWVRRVQDNWLLASIANRWGAERIRLLLVTNGLLSGLLGIAAVVLGVWMLATS
jgi:hypothetical protein